MKYGSVCSGIEAATVAWHPLGWKPAWFAEVDKFPSAVLAHHYPDTPNLGDMMSITDEQLERITDGLLVGGTPCQSFSVAGLRRGLDDPRGNLALGFLRLVDRARPEWVVWENVPGVLSSNGGRDFGAFLGGLGQLGYGWAYRVLDAQYVRVDSHPRAVPQRRRRVFVVGCAGGDWHRAAAVLFERESLSGHPAPRREAGQGATGGVANSLRAQSQDPHRADAGNYVLSALSSGQANAEITDNLSPALNCNRDGAPIVFGLDEEQNSEVYGTLKAREKGGGFEGTVVQGVAPTLDATMDRKWGSNQWVNNGFAVVQPIVFDPTQVTSRTNRSNPQPGDPCHTLNHGTAVRRLTPTECERLQGFPDGYTDVPYRGKPAQDGPRYKALGNSMAVNVMRWIGRRIEAVEAIGGVA